MQFTYISLPYRPISTTCILLNVHLTSPLSIIFQPLSVVITHPKVNVIKKTVVVTQPKVNVIKNFKC